MPDPIQYYDGGGVIVPGNDPNVTIDPNGSAPIIMDTTQEQIDEIENGLVVGYDNNIEVEPFDPGDVPLFPEEPIIKKRLVKIVKGKIVQSRIAYIQRNVISQSKGSGYVFVVPDYDEFINEIVGFYGGAVFFPSSTP